ncbi:MAG: acyl-CoA dehydrogenase [Planctomycetota bacterium]|jgi:alkylation response protein AidB-like acyl-CoA dehydrogenase|nr:acyl-CoA dehydrogenase [Planctomycetota bacterium]
MISLTEEEKLVQETARDFADKELKPIAGEIDRKGAIPKEILQKMAELGFMGVTTPEEYGGAGLSNLCLALIQMEINRGCASSGVTMSVHNSLVQAPLLKYGTEEQKKEYLPKLARGEWIGAYSLSEPVSGSDAGALITSATKEGDHYVLNGAKNFVTNGGIADLFTVFIRTNADKSVKHNAISAFLVKRGTEGFTVGPPEKKMGIRGSTTTTLYFDNCRIPAANLLGAEGEGFKVAMTTLDGGRIGIASQAVGIAKAAMGEAVKYAKERKQFNNPLAKFQAIQIKIANMATDIDAAQLLILRATRMRDEGIVHSKEAAMAKLFSSDMLNRHVTQALQIHGGAGYIKDFPIERHFRDAKITELYEGTSEVQRIVIARNALK